ncbi:MAG: MFS transporter [Gammaproteobacteria bacterium]|nr:MFS transporter [Gammaproteobacteria bacterium]
MLDFSRKAPILLGCVLVFSLFDAATLSLLPVYGIRYGLDISTSALVLTALVIGNTVFQFPVGWLADRFPHRTVLAGCASLAAIMLGLLPIVMATPWMWPVLVLAGTAGYGIYTVSLASLGSRFDGIELINGSASFAMVWGIGALVGSMSGGWSMMLYGPDGLPWHLALVHLLLVLGLCWRAYALKRSS